MNTVLTEKLSKNQPASVWIRDFIDSTNPKFEGKTKKERIAMALGAYYAAQKNEEYGAGFEGTDELRKKYIQDTPGQRIQQFKTEMNQQTYKTYQEFEAQHKKMYPTHSTDQIKSAWEKYCEYFEMEEALQEVTSISFIDDLIDAADKEQRKNKQLRQGQSIMIALKDMNSKLYSDVTGTEYDPFYNDKKIPALMKFLNPNWKFSDLDEAEGKTVESVYNDLTKMSGSALRGILRRMDHPDFNDIKDQGKEDIIAEILMFKFGEDKALEFLENPDNFKMEEAYGDSWVVYDKNTKAQIKPFKTRKGAYDYAAKSGGVVYSAEYYADNKDDIKSGKLVKEEVTKIDASEITAAQIEKYIDNQDFEKLSEISKHLTKDEYKTWSDNGYEGRTYELLMKRRMKNEAINIRDYMATSEKSQFGGYRPHVVNKEGKTMYLAAASYNTPDEAKAHAEEYLKQYARGISEPRVPIKGTYGLKEEKDSYDSWIIKPREGNGDGVKVKAPDETSAIEIALGRKPSQNEIDFFNFHYILIQEKTNVSTLRNMKIVELATKCYDSDLVKEYVEQHFKSKTSALEIKESFHSFITNKRI